MIIGELKNMSLYVRNDEIKSFYFKFILFLFLKEENINMYYEYKYCHKNLVSFDNMFLVYNKKIDKEEIFVFFNYETGIIKKFIEQNDLSKEIKINVFYLDNKYSFKQTEKGLLIEKKTLSKDFLQKLYRLGKENIFGTIKQYLNDNMFSIIMREYKETKAVTNDTLDTVYYKYKGTNGYRVQEMINGEFTFTSPVKFNDPFDCDFEEINFLNGDMTIEDKKDMFRILCVTPVMDNILMWGYYGNNHDGVVVGHTLSDYLVETQKVYNGLIIYGDINYANNRPNYKHDKRYFKLLPFTDFLSNIVQCCFTKYENWKHEKEFRILTFLEGFDSYMKSESNQGVVNYFIAINGNTSNVYVGAKYKGKLNLPISSKKLEKDDMEYKLNIV